MNDFEVKGTPDQVGKLFAALAKAQAMFGMIEKTRTVRVTPKNSAPYTFDYAPLDEVLNKTRDGLTANGLAIMQPVSIGELLTVRTILTHQDGGSVESSCSLPMLKPVWNYDTKSWADPIRMTSQEVGGLVTYWRRYPLCGILGVVAEEDDDANTADGNDRQVAPKTRQTPPERKNVGADGGRPPANAGSTGAHLPAGDSPKPATTHPVATPVPPQVAVSAPAGPSPAVGVPVSVDAVGRIHVVQPDGKVVPELSTVARHFPVQPDAAAKAILADLSEDPGPMTDATGRAIRNALKAAGFTAATQDKAQARVRAIVDKASDDMTEGEGQLILKTLAAEAKP